MKILRFFTPLAVIILVVALLSQARLPPKILGNFLMENSAQSVQVVSNDKGCLEFRFEMPISLINEFERRITQSVEVDIVDYSENNVVATVRFDSQLIHFTTLMKEILTRIDDPQLYESTLRF